MNLWRELMSRKQMIKAFKYSGLYLTVGDDERKIFPKIHSVQNRKYSTEYIFTLPNGLDPHILKKNFFAFHQVFGKNIELKGDYKKFEFHVYKVSLPAELNYDYAAYSEHFGGLDLPIVAGVDLAGKLIAYCMVTNPHLLIAGETGSGKSTQLRSVLSTLIQTLSPDRLQLYLCDLKRSEFYLFRNVEHVQGLFVSAREMLPMLQQLKKEMQHRGDLLDRAEVSHIDELPEKLPYIVLCIDEVALLQDEKDIMTLVEEISAIGRALGVFLILSMQRPDRKVLDGKLKNNLTVRMGFRCADLINSRIIGTPGSEKLKEAGRMLLKLPAFIDLKEVQSPYLSTDKAKKILEGYKCAPPSDRKKQPLNAYESELESENDIFGVLKR
ncbi:FtsK/SpoIIIE domain-containing protein [Mesobacillus thioparans]|uniref:FtsK/SpoIIIE domain-containing protein n=1 Tax=Mesobacillus thioparans TaxID=370439 RepID=UPI0039EFCAFF